MEEADNVAHSCYSLRHKLNSNAPSTGEALPYTNVPVFVVLQSARIMYQMKGWLKTWLVAGELGTHNKKYY